LRTPGILPIGAANGPGAETNRSEVKIGITQSTQCVRSRLYHVTNIDDSGKQSVAENRVVPEILGARSINENGRLRFT